MGANSSSKLRQTQTTEQRLKENPIFDEIYLKAVSSVGPPCSADEIEREKNEGLLSAFWKVSYRTKGNKMSNSKRQFLEAPF